MYSSARSSVIALPLMAAIVRRSACRGSKSVDARTISSPARQPAASRTCMELLPAAAVWASLVQVCVRSPCRFRVPPVSMMPRSPISFMGSSSGTVLVRVMVALRVWGRASVPMASSPCNMTHSVVSSRSAVLAKLSLPSIVRPPSAGGLTSRTTSLPAAMVTLSPAPGTFPSGQVAASDQRACVADGDRPSWAWTTAKTPTSRNAGRSDARRNERWCLLTDQPPSSKMTRTAAATHGAIVRRRSKHQVDALSETSQTRRE